MAKTPSSYELVQNAKEAAKVKRGEFAEDFTYSPDMVGTTFDEYRRTFDIPKQQSNIEKLLLNQAEADKPLTGQYIQEQTPTGPVSNTPTTSPISNISAPQLIQQTAAQPTTQQAAAQASQPISPYKVNPFRYTAMEQVAEAQEGSKFVQDLLGKEGLGRLSGRPEIEGLKQQIASTEARIGDLAKQRVNLGNIQLDEVRNIQEDPELASIQGKLRNIAEQGLSRDEMLAQREQAFREIGRTSQTASRRVQALLAQQGVRGAVAGRQLLDVELAGAQQRGNVERDLFLRSEQLKREATGQLGQYALSRQSQADSRGLQLEQLRQQRSTALAELGLQKSTQEEQLSQARNAQQFEALRGQSEFLTGLTTFDLGQAAKETNLQFQAGLGFSQIASAERSKANQAAIVASQQSSGGGKVICTELHRVGILSDEIMEKDKAYGEKLFIESPETVIGYHLWAKPLVKLMQKSTKLTKVVSWFAIPWALNMSGKSNLLGKILQNTGEPLCKLIGKCVKIVKKIKFEEV